MIICPYWRRIIVRNRSDGSMQTLILCGSEDPNQTPYPDIPDLGARLRRCPWYDSAIAYTHPEISLLEPGFLRPRIVEEATSPGAEGIRELEARWEKVARKFREGRIYTRNRRGEIIL